MDTMKETIPALVIPALRGCILSLVLVPVKAFIAFLSFNSLSPLMNNVDEEAVVEKSSVVDENGDDDGDGSSREGLLDTSWTVFLLVVAVGTKAAT